VLRKIVVKIFVPMLTLLLVIAIMLFLFYYRDRVSELENSGYLGSFFIGLVSSATVFLPTPSILLLFALGAALNPVLVGLLSGIGGAIGELTGYIAGRSGRGIAQDNKWFNRAERWMRRWGTLTVFVFSLVPVLPIDIVGIVAGVLRFPIWKFLGACFLGKTLEYIAIALLGAWGLEALLSFMG